jgi:hypothetical protein
MTTPYERAQIMFNELPEHLRTDLVEAAIWARDTLRDKEGAGHHFELSPDGVNGGTMSCSFAKPEWPGDHSGAYMPTAAEAITIAVCEYLCGC